MGRGGGSSRGGGGSFGGSRGGGGRSGGSLGSRGGSFGRSGGFSRPSKRARRPTGGNLSGGLMGAYLGSKMAGGNRSRHNGGSSGRGCGTVLIVLLIFVVLMAVLLSLNSASTDLTKSTVVRDPLPEGSVNETGYYTDQLGWIGNQTLAIEGLKYFYERTGVQPHVYITDSINGSHDPSFSELEEFANSLYDQLFTDEAHILLVFFEYSSGDYMDYYVTGTQAKGVVDTEAGDILLDYIDQYYYDSSLSDEEFFSKAFSDSADRMMDVTKSPWISVFVVLGSMAILLILFSWWKRAKRQKNLEAKQTEEILNTPIEKYSDSEVEDLAKKYDNDHK